MAWELTGNIRGPAIAVYDQVAEPVDANPGDLWVNPNGPEPGQGPQGPPGEDGQDGAPGEDGAQGPAGPAGHSTVVYEQATEPGAAVQGDIWIVP